MSFEIPRSIFGRMGGFSRIALDHGGGLWVKRGNTSPTKRRDECIYIGRADRPPTEARHIRDPINGDSIGLPDDGHDDYSFFYRRERARESKTDAKSIYALYPFFGSREIRISSVHEILRYDGIFAIDTNFPQAAYTTVISAVWSERLHGFKLKNLGTRKFSPRTSEFEKEGWVHFLKNAALPADRRYCLFVDSALSELMDFNKRSRPIIEDFYLPQNWQMNYATSDVRDDFIGVQMIRRCDKLNKMAAKADR